MPKTPRKKGWGPALSVSPSSSNSNISKSKHDTASYWQHISFADLDMNQVTNVIGDPRREPERKLEQIRREAAIAMFSKDKFFEKPMENRREDLQHENEAYRATTLHFFWRDISFGYT